MTDPRKVSILDLTPRQLEAIEKEVGVPSRRWATDAPSDYQLIRLVYGAATGEDVGDVPMRTLQGLVDLEGAEEADPTLPTAAT